MQVVAYQKKHARMWDEFVRHSLNATFLLQRDYMDYHADRFEDASLLFLDDKERLCGLLAANACSLEKQIVAHGGLTYGGLIVNHRLTTLSACSMLTAAAREYRARGFETMLYKPVPCMYHVHPAQEDLYVLFRAGAVLVSRAISTAIDFSIYPEYSNLRKRKIKKAQSAGIRVAEVCEKNQWQDFHAILKDVLYTRHRVFPVHSAEELQLLAARFPENIRLFTAFDENICAGIVVYDTKRVFHLQYIAANDHACNKCALDALIDHTIHIARKEGHRYFDFGISTEQDGRRLNKGLIFQKEGFGGHAFCYDAYMVNLNELAHLCM